jgi:hypothetical protein
MVGPRPLCNQLGCRFACNGPMQLVLHRLEECLRNLGVAVVVDTALLVNIRDLQVEAALAGTNLPNPLQQFIEVILAESLALLQTLIVQHEPLHDELA